MADNNTKNPLADLNGCENDMLLKCVCEACGREEILTAQQAFDQGWDYPPLMGAFGVIGPRTCGNCTIDKTLWWALTCEKKTIADLTDHQKATLKRILSEPLSIVVSN